MNDTKCFFCSKTVWIAIVTIIIAILQSQGVTIPDWIIQILLGSGLLIDRVSNKKITRIF